jgi:hypothetical protein
MRKKTLSLERKKEISNKKILIKTFHTNVAPPPSFYLKNLLM